MINDVPPEVLHQAASWEVIMDGYRPSSIEVAPLQADGSLYGFMLLGRWPNDTVEWAKFLVLAVQMAAVPGLLSASTVFRIREELPEQPHPGAIGLVVAEGQLLGEHPLRPGHFADHQPPGLIVLHPPSSTLASIPEYNVASGCVFLPGLPYLGLDHRAAWVEADVEGTVTQLISKVGIDPQVNADTAALAMLLAA
ncbi:MAG TPA: peptidase [Propionibacteriaceae bacterium]|nr:peptidase [Propionibacteriaceae bacterium]